MSRFLVDIVNNFLQNRYTLPVFSGLTREKNRDNLYLYKQKAMKRTPFLFLIAAQRARAVGCKPVPGDFEKGTALELLPKGQPCGPVTGLIEGA